MLPFVIYFNILVAFVVSVCLKVNSKEICEERLFFYYFSKNVTSPVFPILKLNYRRKMPGYPQFSFWILIARAKICFSRIVIFRAKMVVY